MSESDIFEHTQSLMLKGDFQAAEEVLRERLRLQPIPDSAFWLMTDILIHAAKFSDAIQFVNAHTNNPEIFVRLRDYFVGERMNENALNLIAATRLDDPGISYANDSIRKQMSGDLPGAIDACNNALRLNTNDASAYNQLGRVLFNAGHTQQSQSAFEKAITLKPEFAEAWHNLGHVLRAQNKLEESEKAYTKSTEIAPYYRSGLLNLGIVQFSRGKNTDALYSFKKLLQLDPENAEAYLNAGIAEHILRNASEARHYYERALALQPKSPITLRHLASLFAEELNTDAAIKYYRQALAINSRMGDVWAELIELYERSNRIEDAQQALIEATRILSNDANVQYLAAKMARRNNHIDASVKLFRQVNANQLHPRFLQSYYFESGNTFDRSGDYLSAFQAFERGNDLASRSIRAKQTDFSAFDRHMDAVEEWLRSGANVEKYENDEDLGEDLCFLLGFPRSGTTLLDVMLDGHQDTQTLEERATFEHVAFAMDKNFGGYPFGTSNLIKNDREMLRKQYRKTLIDEGLAAEKTKLIIDKMPIRTVHAACIHRLFPRAKFLFALRHPCDVILSNYMQNFAANEVFVHFNTLTESTRMYERVMRIWKTTHQIMPIPVHFVRYEQLVSDTERTLQDVCRFLELPWMASMSSHQDTLKERGRIKTNSYHQVAEPVYQRSINRWHNYRPQFEAHLDRIKPYADYFSYSLD
jgi:tetratricopeptide (TPR) repeat protein